MYQPTYTINQKILKLIGSIEAAREVIEHAALVPQWERQFREDAMQRTVHHGTHLEGNELSPEQAERVVDLKETRAEEAAEKAGIVGRDRDVQEVINYRRVMEWVDEHGVHGHKKFKIDERLLKAVHELVTYRILPEEERGEFREVEVVVKNSETGKVSFRPPPHVEVPVQIEELFEWFNSDEGCEHHSVIRSGIVHYELVRVHPFTDGNGRTARVVALLTLYAEGYDLKRFFSLDEYYDKHALEYYQALQSVSDSDEDDLTYWLEFFVEGLAVELDKVKQQVLKLSKDVQLKSKIGKQVALSDRQIKILEVLKNQDGRAVSSDFEEVLPMVSLDTILRDVKDLIDKGLVKKKGKTKGAYYVLVE